MPLHVLSTCAHHQEVRIALHSLWYHHTYRWPSRAQVERGLHTCSKHVEAWNELIVKQKFCASIWLITEINILRCTVFKTSKNVKYVFWFFLQFLSKKFLILRRIRRDGITNAHRSSCRGSVILVRFKWNLNFLGRFSKINQTSNFIKIHSVGAELFSCGRADRYDEANSRFSQFCQRA